MSELVGEMCHDIEASLCLARHGCDFFVYLESEIIALLDDEDIGEAFEYLTIFWIDESQVLIDVFCLLRLAF